MGLLKTHLCQCPNYLQLGLDALQLCYNKIGLGFLCPCWFLGAYPKALRGETGLGWAGLGWAGPGQATLDSFP